MTMSKGLISVAVTVLCLSIGATARAQYMFLDTTGDGLNTSSDALATRGSSYVDIWIQTDVGRDGQPTALRDDVGNKPSIFSYTFILRAVGGAVRWGKYVNLQPTMTVPFGPRQNETDYYNGFGGRERLPAGKFKLGRLEVSVESGTPTIEIVTKTSLWAEARTSFGSHCLGSDGDNTLKLGGVGTAAEPVGTRWRGDWTDIAGVGVRVGAVASDAMRNTRTDLTFGARVVQNGSADAAIHFTTARDGFARVRLFDLSGRHVRTLLDERFMNPGEHIARIGATPASGVYFYKVETPEGWRSGRILVLRR